MESHTANLHKKLHEIGNGVKPDRCVQYLEALIRIPSPSGEERELAQWIGERLREIGFQDAEVDNWDNVIGHLEGNSRHLLMSAHLDTSKPSPGMDDPFTPRIQVVEDERRIYGLGTATSKGSIASMLEALSAIAKSKQEMPSITFVGIARDLLPTSGYGIRAIFREHNIAAKAAIVGEPTNLQVGIGSRGLAHIEVIFHGEPRHAGRPDNQRNPVTGLANFIRRALEQSLPEHSLFGAATMTPIECSSEGSRPQTPRSARVVMDRRLLPNDPSIETLLNEYEAWADSAAGPMKYGVNLQNHEYPWEVSADTEIVSCVAESLRVIAKREPVYFPLPFASTAGYMKEFGGIQPVAFSGGDIAKMGPNEYASVDSIVTAARVMASAIILFGNASL